MKTNNVHSEQVYTTLDRYQSGFLTLRGFVPRLIEQSGKVVLVFIQTKELLQALADYQNGAVVEAARFAFAIKTLKSQIHSMRKNKENLYGREKIGQ